jgi:RNA polymerase sigma-70 factor (ECF subfamily)
MAFLSRESSIEIDSYLDGWRDWGFRVALKITGCHEAAFDALQEALIRAVRSQMSLRDPAMAHSWFRRILIRCALAQKPTVQFALADTGSIELGEGAIEAIHVRATLSRLKPKQRAILALALGEGLSYEEIAEALGIPIGTVGSRLSAAREAFRKAWGNER